jgi:hypothetical protein
MPSSASMCVQDRTSKSNEDETRLAQRREGVEMAFSVIEDGQVFSPNEADVAFANDIFRVTDAISTVIRGENVQAVVSALTTLLAQGIAFTAEDPDGALDITTAALRVAVKSNLQRRWSSAVMN